MEQSDFLQRQLDLLGRILGKALTDLLGIKNNSQIIEEFETINQIITSELKISLNELIELKKDAFIEIITSNPKFNLNNISLSPGASGRICILNLWIIHYVFYHCATLVQAS